MMHVGGVPLGRSRHACQCLLSVGQFGQRRLWVVPAHPPITFIGRKSCTVVGAYWRGNTARFHEDPVSPTGTCSIHSSTPRLGFILSKLRILIDMLTCRQFVDCAIGRLLTPWTPCSLLALALSRIDAFVVTPPNGSSTLTCPLDSCALVAVQSGSRGSVDLPILGLYSYMLSTLSAVRTTTPTLTVVQL
ncbi:hypothetical protein EXIGLDRAFT_215250 [Exidia glandulosa HHB12029]|uniref:Uncharacterized protein n=1 Tax=Exidia glandulosa HHB12029 TaxID=1314781 RepID=A0A165MU42_EXIGL|nr:hypothetical protein EXIGLDRAFT_215250 [Exidia glandulosa HHB12029]